MKSLRLEPFEEGSKCYSIYHFNGVYIGDFLQKEDGYYDFWPDNSTWRTGYWDELTLRALADTLHELNKEWDNVIQNDPAIAGPKDIQLHNNDPISASRDTVGNGDKVG